MIRILSLLLFGLLLYNMVGYSIVYLLEENHTISTENQDYILRDSYSRDIVIKVPVSLPYQTNWEKPESAYGRIRHNGEHYQMKTKQLINDTIYVHCEFDQNARDRFSALVSNIMSEVTGNVPHKTSASTVLKNFFKEYMTSARKHVFFIIEWPERSGEAVAQYQPGTSERHSNTPFPPPDQA